MQKTGKKTTEHPFAKAFYKRYFGTATPKKSDIQFFVDANLTAPVITHEIDRLIESNGEYRGNLSARFITMLFPCLQQALETRFNNHYQLKEMQEQRVTEKQRAKRECEISRLRSAVKFLSPKELPIWVTEFLEHLSDFEQRDILRSWYINAGYDMFDFNLYYSNMLAKDIALDLSYS